MRLFISGFSVRTKFFSCVFYPLSGKEKFGKNALFRHPSPRLCVQVKSSESPLDRPTLDQLIGSMQNFSAEQGLLVSWGGFKSSVDKEIPSQFFRVRLWDQKAIINELLHHYDSLDEDIKAEIPLKRMWSLAVPDE